MYEKAGAEGLESARLRCPKFAFLAIARQISTAAQDIARNEYVPKLLWRYPSKTGDARFPRFGYIIKDSLYPLSKKESSLGETLLAFLGDTE